MVTDISGAGISHSVPLQAGAEVVSRALSSFRPAETGRNAVVSSSQDKFDTSVSSVVGAFAQLRSRQESINQVASTVREVSQVVDKAEQLLSKMEDDLTAVVKIYPPYPIDNPERISLLNNFGALRKQIDALTFPPPEELEAVGRVLGAKETDEETGLNNSLDVSLPHIFSDEQGLGVPSLDAEAASDEEIAIALDQVKSMKSYLEQIQTSMWEDVVSFVNQADTPEAKSEGAAVRDLLSSLTSEHGIIGRNALQLGAVAESR